MRPPGNGARKPIGSFADFGFQVSSDFEPTLRGLLAPICEPMAASTAGAAAASAEAITTPTLSALCMPKLLKAKATLRACSSTATASLGADSTTSETYWGQAKT